MPVQVELPDHRRPQKAGQVGEARELEAGHYLLRDRRASKNVPPLKHTGPKSSSRKVRRSYETVVATTDDNGVVTVPLRSRAAVRPVVLPLHSLCHFFKWHL